MGAYQTLLTCRSRHVRSLILSAAAIVAAALTAGCDHGIASMAPTGATVSAPTFAAGAVNPNTLVPVPPPGATCRADGEWIICRTSLAFAAVNEPSADVLPCGQIYQTGSDQRHSIRWYTSDGLLAKRFVRQNVDFTWSLSPNGDGPLAMFSVHANWRNPSMQCSGAIGYGAAAHTRQ